MIDPIKVLDHGYVHYVEHYGKGDADIDEAGIIEAARQSTQGNFRSWEPYWLCEECNLWDDSGPNLLASVIPRAECTSPKGHQWKQYKNGDEGLLKFLFSGKPQHATPFEFCGLVIEVQAPIFVFREWHRHRTQSYNEMSARYAPLPDLNYVPDWGVLKSRGEVATKNRQASRAEPWNELMAKQWHSRLPEVYEYLQKVYTDGLMAGVPKEVARVCLPVGRYSRMRANANLRNWLAFLTLRADPAAQWEIQQYANAVGSIISACFPRTWNLFELARKG